MAPLYLETIRWREVRFLLCHGRHMSWRLWHRLLEVLNTGSFWSYHISVLRIIGSWEFKNIIEHFFFWLMTCNIFLKIFWQMWWRPWSRAGSIIVLMCCLISLASKSAPWFLFTLWAFDARFLKESLKGQS